MHIIKTTEKINGPICARRICRQRINTLSKYNENVRSLQALDIAFAHDGKYISNIGDKLNLKSDSCSQRN
jgi:hypothetical protein